MAHALTAAVSAPSRRWPQRPEIVSRERLVQRLAQARDVPLALLIAPAGYGKTTLLEDWAAHDGRPFAWLTLDSESNDPARLLSSIARALDTVEPLEPAARETLGGLTDALGRTATPLVLALDEADALHTRAAREVVLALAAAMPAGSALALASRTDFALPLGRLRAQRRPIELRADDLALTTSEANALLRLAGLELGSERLLTLMRRTGGWPAGLHLAALSLREQGGDAGRGLQRRRPLRGGLRTRGDSGPPPRRPAALLGAHVGARSPQCAELRRRARPRRLGGAARAARALQRADDRPRSQRDGLPLPAAARGRAAGRAAPARARPAGRAPRACERCGVRSTARPMRRSGTPSMPRICPARPA